MYHSKTQRKVPGNKLTILKKKRKVIKKACDRNRGLSEEERFKNRIHKKQTQEY